MCEMVSYPHAHCPCGECKQKAVSRSTEYRHWEAHNSVATNTGNSTTNDTYMRSVTDSESEYASDVEFEDRELGEDDVNDNHDENEETTLALPQSPQSSVYSDKTDDIDSSSSEGENPLTQTKTIAHDDLLEAKDKVKHVKAVIDAMRINDSANGSEKHFMDILMYGKELCNHDTEEETQSWPKTWKASIKMLKKEGYKEPIEYKICLDNMHYNVYDIMGSHGEICRYRCTYMHMHTLTR